MILCFEEFYQDHSESRDPTFACLSKGTIRYTLKWSTLIWRNDPLPPSFRLELIPQNTDQLY